MNAIPPVTLRDLQVWLQQAITHSAGAAPTVAEIADQLTATTRQSAVERLEVYQRAYFARLLECLQAMFPALHAVLQDEAFTALALAYLEQHPPRAYTLNVLVDRFVEYLQTTRPQQTSETLDWVDFVIELARLEHAIDLVFDGPGHEGAPLLSLAELQAIAPEESGRLRLRLSPSLRLLEFHFPVNDVYSAFRAGELSREAPFPAPQASYLALHRRDYIVQRYPLTRAQFVILQTLEAGGTLEESIAAAAPAEDLPLAQWFHDWMAAGLFVGIDSPQS